MIFCYFTFLRFFVFDTKPHVLSCVIILLDKISLATPALFIGLSFFHISFHHFFHLFLCERVTSDQ